MLSRIAVVGALLGAGLAWATPDYPNAIKSDLGLAAGWPTRQCAICHKNNNQVASSVVTPFALSMKAKGMVSYNQTSLLTALRALDDAGTDSDGDGCSDLQELRTDDDPNVVSCGVDGGTTGGLPAPRYGCGAEVVPGLMAALAVVALVRVLRRRAPRAG
jgi:hypothetical protein